MSTSVISRNNQSFVLQIDVPVNQGNMLVSEGLLLEQLNEAGKLGTHEILERFDVTSHDPIIIQGQKLTYKHQVSKRYETPYGAVDCERAVYQESGGGTTLAPLDYHAHIVGSATPRLAKMVSSKYSKNAAPAVEDDLASNHGRKLSQSYIKNLCDRVGYLIEEYDHEDYELPELDEPVASIAIGLDGTCMLLCDDGWREAMCGTVSLYDSSGHRQYTVYVAEAPEYGKARFLRKLEHEVGKVRERYPDACYIGVADGAKENWRFLKQLTDFQLLDFFHVSEYVAGASHALFPDDEGKRQTWLEERLHRLKHKRGAASRLLHELEQAELPRRTTALVEKRYKAVTYLKNNLPLMRYYHAVKRLWPIGSGVTEAACKTLVKQRFCCAGMRWKHESASIVLGMRALTETKGRWDQLWERITCENRLGEPVSAY